MLGCESWTIKKTECQRIDAFELLLEKTLGNALNSKEIQPVHPKRNQAWIFFGRIDAEAETPILESPDGKNLLIGKDLNAGKDWRWEEKRTEENEMVGWHHQWMTWIWVSSRNLWWTRKPGVLQSMGLQRVEHDWVTKLNWTELVLDGNKHYSTQERRVSF